MEYERTDDGKMQADLAKRLGIILQQYNDYKTNDEKYEVSLTLAILQNLLTNCDELFKAMSKKDKKKNPLSNHIDDNTFDWGISETCIKINTFANRITYQRVFNHLRNSLSHPTIVNNDSEFLSTGYISENHSSSIEKVLFFDSPDIKYNKQKYFKTSHDAITYLENTDFQPSAKVEEKDKKFIITQDSEPPYRICKIELTPKEILNLAYSLCSYLSHPLQDNWDGITYKLLKLVA